jgi:hypothetical protein
VRPIGAGRTGDDSDLLALFWRHRTLNLAC